MCAVGGLVRMGAQSVCLAGHHSSCLSSIGQIYVKMVVVIAEWCRQLTNEHCEVLFFINAHVLLSVKKLNPAYMGPIRKI